MEKHSRNKEHQKQGLVFGIQHFSVHDGSGIRSNVFLKGCPLRCRWCHNPEGLAMEVQMQYYENKCMKCGKCGGVYRNPEKINLETDEKKKEYADQCIYHALEVVGTYMTSEEIIKEVLEDQKFFQSSEGGMTVSGGEPMLQPEFVADLLKLAKKHGLSTAMETSGYALWKHYENMLPYVDEFLWDYKVTDNEEHKKFTGVGNKQILENLKLLHEKGANITLRCPVIPGINDTEEHFRGIAGITLNLPRIKGAQLMPYHKMGTAKAQRLGQEQQEFLVPSKSQVEDWKRRIRQSGGRVIE